MTKYKKASHAPEAKVLKRAEKLILLDNLAFELDSRPSLHFVC